jgi:hypothetical protein
MVTSACFLMVTHLTPCDRSSPRGWSWPQPILSCKMPTPCWQLCSRRWGDVASETRVSTHTHTHIHTHLERKHTALALGGLNPRPFHGN